MTYPTTSKSIDEYLYGYVHIELFHLANKYKIFQTLVEHQGATLDELTATLTLNRDALERIMISLTASDVLICQQQRFTISESFLAFFDRDDDGYIGNFIHFIRNQGRAALQQLEAHLTDQTLSQSPYDTMYDSPSDTTDFTQAMWELSYSSGKGLAALLPNDCQRIVDIGGGSGALATALVEAQFCQHITVFDLPGVAADFDKKISAHQLNEQIDFVAGDFFADELPTADTYFLSYVLSNWSTDKIITLLKRIAQKLTQHNGKLIVFERLFEADGIKPFATAVMHLNMMLHTQGRHRSAAQYRQLFTEAGFTELEIINTPFDKQILIART